MHLNTSKLERLSVEQLFALYDRIEQLLIKIVEGKKTQVG